MMQLLFVGNKNAINDSPNATDDVTASLWSSRLGISDQLALEWIDRSARVAGDEALSTGFVQAIDADVEAP